LSWKADLVGKFVPALAFFYLQNDDLHLFFPQSNDLCRIDKTADVLSRLVELEPNLFRNFNFAFSTKLGTTFSRRSEVATAFLHRVCVAVTDQKRAAQARRELERLEAFDKTITLGGDDDEQDEVSEVAKTDTVSKIEIESLISTDDVFKQTQMNGPVGFTIVSATKKGNVWMARDFWKFQDIVYVARLFNQMLTPIRYKAGNFGYECEPSAFFRTLIDHDAKDETRTLLRDKVCEDILQRRPVLNLLERHAFHVNSHSDSAKAKPISSLLRFAKFYEVELRKGTKMEESYAAMVKTATWLGDTIGKAVAAKVNDKQAPEPRGQARGALFRLRKTRTTSDFMNELARLQFRYDIDVPDKLADAQVLNHDTFEEFRGFCVVAALSRYLSATREPKKPNVPTG
jgi:hypothetical protein